MIPYSRPYYSKRDKACFLAGLKPMANADHVRHLAEADIAHAMGDYNQPVLVTNSCTSALMLAHRALDRNYTTWVPSLSWYSTWSHVNPTMRKHYDLCPDSIVPDLPTDKIEADDVLFLVDLYGDSTVLSRLLDTSLDNVSAPIILDAAHNFADPHHQDWLRLGKVAAICYSFNSIKQVSAVRGGAIAFSPVWFTPENIRMVRAWSDSGSIGRDGMTDWGFNAEMGEPNALLLRSQLETFNARQQRTKQILCDYSGSLLSRRCELYGRSGHIAVLKFSCPEGANLFRAAAHKAGFRTGHHYPFPHYLSPMEFPNSFDLSQRVVTVPLWYGMTDAQVAKVCRCLRSFTQYRR